jgi:hypothetical protein
MLSTETHVPKKHPTLGTYNSWWEYIIGWNFYCGDFYSIKKI